MGIRDIFGRNIDINHEIRDRYDNISSGFIFKNNQDLNNKHIFMLCFALGYKLKNRKIVHDKVPLLNVKSFDDEDLWTIAAVAVEEMNDLKIITSGPDMRKIASEYAYGGLDELEQLIADYGSGDGLELVLEKIARESLENN